MHHVKILKLKKNKLSEPLLQYLRVNLISSFKTQKGSIHNNYNQHLLVSAPVDLDFELLILKTGIDLVANMLRTKFTTTLEDDQNALKAGGIPWRLYLAMTHRTAQKEVLQSQERILTIALKIMQRLKGSKELGQGEVVTLKDAYIKPVEGLE